MDIAVIGEQLFSTLFGRSIEDQRVLDFIHMAEWISLWIGVVVGLISLFGLIAIYAERKVSAHMQSRLGPMRVGPKGLLQTLADGVKLLEKEDLTPRAADAFLFVIAPCFVFASAVAMFVVLPFASWQGKQELSVLDLHATELALDELEAEEADSESVELARTELEARKYRRAKENREQIKEAAEQEEFGQILLTTHKAFQEQSEKFSQRWDSEFREFRREHPDTFDDPTRAYKVHDEYLRTHRVKWYQGSHPTALSQESKVRVLGLIQSYHHLQEQAQQESKRLQDTGVLEPELKKFKEEKAALLGAFAPLKEFKVSSLQVDRPWFGTPAYINAGLFFILAISSVSVMGVVLAGWASNNKWSLYGAIREAAQMVSYEIPMGIGALCVVVANHSLNLMDIAQIQEQGLLLGLSPDFHGGILSWNILKYPLTLLPVFILFYVGVLAHTKRAPFDLPEAESELIAGFLTEYSGMRWSLFFLAEYGEMYAMSALTAVLFLGGMAGVVPGLDGVIKSVGPAAWFAWGAFNLILKTLFLVFVMMWLRWTLPRIRLDQVMYLCLKVLLPFTMVALLLQTLWTLYLG